MADWHEIKAYIKEYAYGLVASAIQFTYFTVTSAMGVQDATEGTLSYSSEPKTQYPTKRMQHFGFRSVPPAGTAAVRLLASGGSYNAVSVAEDPDPSYGPSDLVVGEAALYNAVANAIVKLVSDGKIIIVPGAGSEVYLGDTSLGVNDGVVHGSAIEPLTGVSYTALGSTSTVVKAKK